MRIIPLFFRYPDFSLARTVDEQFVDAEGEFVTRSHPFRFPRKFGAGVTSRAAPGRVKVPAPAGGSSLPSRRARLASEAFRRRR
jgi:hypothetical protein